MRSLIDILDLTTEEINDLVAVVAYYGLAWVLLIELLRL